MKCSPQSNVVRSLKRKKGKRSLLMLIFAISDDCYLRSFTNTVFAPFFQTELAKEKLNYIYSRIKYTNGFIFLNIFKWIKNRPFQGTDTIQYIVILVNRHNLPSLEVFRKNQDRQRKLL